MAGFVRNTGCILADTMGLGKTLQVIAMLHLFIKQWSHQQTTSLSQSPTSTQSQTRFPKLLLIAPATVLRHWVTSGSNSSAAFEVRTVTRKLREFSRKMITLFVEAAIYATIIYNNTPLKKLNYQTPNYVAMGFSIKLNTLL